MRDNDSKLIWESYTVNEREYGPSGAPSLDVATWGMGDWYTVDEWEDGPPSNPWTKYTENVIDDLRADGDGDSHEFVTFFMPEQGSSDYEAWTDPGIVVAFDSTGNYSKGIFVDNDGEGESHILAPEIVKTLVDVNWNNISNYIKGDLETKRAEADAEREIDRFAPFDRDY